MIHVFTLFAIQADASEPFVRYIRSEWHTLNRLKGVAGNAINAVLAAAAMNFHKFLGAFWRIFMRCLQAICNGLQLPHGPEALHT